MDFYVCNDGEELKVTLKPVCTGLCQCERLGSVCACVSASLCIYKCTTYVLMYTHTHDRYS